MTTLQRKLKETKAKAKQLEEDRSRQKKGRPPISEKSDLVTEALRKFEKQLEKTNLPQAT
jgi:hypothetical protein